MTQTNAAVKVSRLKAVDPKTAESRFLAKLDKGDPAQCWIWKATKLPSGYGLLGKGPRGSGYFYAHRLSYLLYKGEIPEGLHVCHTCDNPSCVNPNHLFVGSAKQNQKDKVNKGRQLRGLTHPNSILTPQIVKRIREEYSQGETSLSILGRKHGIGFQHVHDIVKNRIWRHV